MESHDNSNTLEFLHKGYTCLPESAKSFLRSGNVTHVFLAGQSFREIPAEFIDCNSIKVLVLDEQGQTHKTKSETSQISIQNIHCFQINPEIGQMTSLVELYLANNAVRDLPVSIEKLHSLVVLDLSLNLFEEIPTCLYGLNQLQKLLLCSNRITRIPDGIQQMEELTVLRLEDNRLTSVPGELSDLVKLKVLTLRGNPLQDIPQFLRDLDRYEHICVDDEHLQCSQSFDGLTTAQRPPSNRNKHKKGGYISVKSETSIVEAVVVKETRVTGELGIDDIYLPKEGAVKIVANKLGLQTLNSNLEDVNNTTFLLLDENTFHRLPIKELQAIRKIIGLSMNKQQSILRERSALGCVVGPIFTIPDSIHVLPHLVELSLQNNRIGELPCYIMGLINLKVLDLTNNCIRYLPEELFSLESLEYLSLSSNSLTIVPDEVGNLKKLRVLRLSKNKLQCLPDSICGLQELMCLSLKDNQLFFLPPKLFELRKCLDESQVFRPEVLQNQFRPQLSIQGNKNLMFPPFEICSDSSTEKIFDYLTSVDRNQRLLERLMKDAKEKISQPATTAEDDYLPIAVGGPTLWRSSRISSMMKSCDPKDMLGDVNLMQIALRIPEKWKQLGTHLQLSYHDIAAIDMDKHDVVDKAFSMLMAWRNSQPNAEEESLRVALKKIKEIALIESFLTARPTPLPDPIYANV